MSRLKNIKELLKFSNDQLVKIEEMYEFSLSEKEIKPILQILIKCYLESLRSCLDYCAKDISEYISSSTTKKIYFPICKSCENISNFQKKVDKYLPGLEIKNKNLYNLLEKFQPYYKDYEWLGELTTLVNDNKHDNLSPQIQKQENVLKISGGTKNIKSELIMRGGFSFYAAPGSFINGKKVENEPLIINPEKDIPLRAFDYMPKISKEIWKFFVFDEIKKEALPLLKQFNKGIEKIIDEIYKCLEVA